uniref:Uncharacterized protein n=1 Tax=Romanomermis culicivorax TaxID=13658 RepID=A0A915JJL5_ROMCU
MKASSTFDAVFAEVSIKIRPCSRANASPSSFLTSRRASKSLKIDYKLNSYKINAAHEQILEYKRFLRSRLYGYKWTKYKKTPPAV